MLVDKFNRKQLWHGCILATIAHAVMVGECPNISHEQSWDGVNYNIQNSSGCRGTITFGEKYLVAVFQDNNNGKKIKECIEKGALGILSSNNNLIEQIANEEALQYVLENVNEEIIPVITTGFWGINDQIFAKEEYITIEKNGAYIISEQILGYDNLLQALIESYEMNETQVKLTELIYEKKINNSTDKIYLSDEERNILYELYEDEIDECVETFNEINIYI